MIYAISHPAISSLHHAVPRDLRNMRYISIVEINEITNAFSRAIWTKIGDCAYVNFEPRIFMLINKAVYFDMLLCDVQYKEGRFDCFTALEANFFCYTMFY